ncbi:glycosyltransferase [Salinarimonas ramus]|uniref:Glycosyltransferase WbpZ n=1 Tax=Salinarimonas ramus TaxID=690164 RepID=A0A917V798_9HYPH|nr:glycosyltransferase [Salinarimonas ramus]GGK46842.1 glycosyltransferase WbpZ [Salinarimonas ramus]
MTLNVLHVYRTYFPDPPGGLQEAIRQICRATAPLGVESTIFTLSPDPRPTTIRMDEATVVRARSYAAPASCDLGGPEALIRFRALAAKADVVHYLHPWPFADLMGVLGRRDRPVVLTYISDIVRQRTLGRLYAPLMRRHLRHADVIVANAPSYAATSPILSVPEVAPRVRVVPLGIVRPAQAPEADARVLARLSLEGRPFFLFLGVLRYYKGVEFLVRAAAQAGTTVVVAGDGPERQRLESIAHETGADVRFAGFVTDAEKHALLSAARALVLPSHLRSEAFGMVLVEAAMAGKPAISTEIGTGTSFVVAHDASGLVVPPEDPPALAGAMRRLADEPGLAERLGAGALERYEAMFSGEALGKGYRAAFEDAIARRRAAR